MRFYDMDCNPSQLSPLTLAFVGDAVFDLFVRERLVCLANRPVNRLHSLAVSLVKASSQARAAKRLSEILSEKELSVLKRGRNAHTNHKAKNASESDYHYATGLEALFGFLYLSGESDRLRELFELTLDFIEEDYVAQTAAD
ncbi:MAG: ribonuclease III domain-containing protein [Clostridiaceae bacterium]|nr:ribonuclease III domain-containing protein [Clostridiaceae bacterium]MDY5991079.1 ribonuclease III domain-containing protein [Oscillospiraceae bacterium]